VGTGDTSVTAGGIRKAALNWAPLQINKVRDAIQFFDVIPSLDRDKFAAEIAK
jgi:uncharacterized pyridoxal phosphate-containing UPF0001 family protein